MRTIDDEVRHSNLGRILGLESKCGDIGEPRLDDVEHVVVGDVQHVCAVDTARLVHLSPTHQTGWTMVLLAFDVSACRCSNQHHTAWQLNYDENRLTSCLHEWFTQMRE